METQWITWALQGLIAAVLYWFKQQLDKNTDAVTNMREDLPRTYMPRKESEDARRELRDSVHDLRDEIGKVSNRLARNEGANDLAERLATVLKK